MPTRPFSDLYNYVLPYVPGVETPLVDFHIRRVVREFCRRTTLWRHRVELTTEPGVPDYILSPYDATLGGATVMDSHESWIPLRDAGIPFALTTIATNTFEEEVSLGDDSVLRFRTTSELTQQNHDNFVEIRITYGNPEDAPRRIRVTFVPESDAYGPYTEQNYDGSGELVPIPLPQGYFYRMGDGGSGFGSEPYAFNNLATIEPDGRVTSYAPNPIVMENTIGVYNFSNEIGFTTGSGWFYEELESSRYPIVFFSALIEVEGDAVAPTEPEICDPYSILSVVVAGKGIPPIAESARDPFGARPANTRPRAWYQPSARVLHLYPAPDAAYPVVVDIVCALTMEPTVNVMPEFLLVDYREVIADGVVSSLKQLNGKPWYDPQGAAEFGTRFRQSTQAIRARLRDAYQPGSFTVRAPRFGR